MVWIGVSSATRRGPYELDEPPPLKDKSFPAKTEASPDQRIFRVKAGPR